MKKRTLVIIAIVWLLLITAFIFFSPVCPLMCLPDNPEICGCEIYIQPGNLFWNYLIFGIPSWIIFIWSTIMLYRTEKKK